MKIFFRVCSCQLLFVFSLTLSLLGCSRFLAPQSEAFEVAPAHERQSPPAVPAQTLTRQSPPSSLPALEASPVSSGTSAVGSDPSPPPQDGRIPVVTQSEFSYENATLTEDATWRGTVVVRGYLVIASQATLNIEPGTVVRFMKSPIMGQVPRLVVLGRIQCLGTSDQPVLFAPNGSGAVPGAWGGILLLSSEKRNQFEHVRVDGAQTGLEVRFSALAANDIRITGSRSGVVLRDSTARLRLVRIENCATALEASDSELDLRESSLDHNQYGISAFRTGLALQGVSVRNSEQQGVMAHDCRIRFMSCELAENGGGARLLRVDGQIFRTRFIGNRVFGLDLTASRLKIQQSLFADTLGDALRLDNGQSVIWESAFERNSGHNLVNSGVESVSAVLNWWGSSRETSIAQKLYDTLQDPQKGTVIIFPWLPERPVSLP